MISPRKNEKARFPGRGVEHYLQFYKESDRAKYHGKSKIPMETFHEMYFEGDVDFKGDALEVMEYRHDWANFRMTLSLYRFFLTGMIPEMLMHTRSQGRIAILDYQVVLIRSANSSKTRNKSATTTTVVTTFTVGSSAPA